MALEHDTQVLAKQILEDLKPELIIPSPYSIWDPSRMKFEVAGVTNPQSLAEMQALLVKKAFTVSDMYILQARYCPRYPDARWRKRRFAA